MEMPPLFWAGILLTKVTVPPLSTLAAGGVTFLISTVALGAAAALGAMSTDAVATPTQARTAAASPRRAVRRIRRDAIFGTTSSSGRPGTGPQPRHAARTMM